MSESRKQGWRDMTARQWLITLAVLAILIGAPYGSYTYLKKGFNYRVESLQQLQPKEVSQDLLMEIEAAAPFVKHARLVHMPGEQLSAERALLLKIDSQIVDRDRFEIIAFDEPISGDIEHEIQFIDGTISSKGDIDFMLIDTSNVVRGTYHYYDDLGKELIRHLSVIVPVPKRKEIHLNRNFKE